MGIQGRPLTAPIVVLNQDGISDFLGISPVDPHATIVMVPFASGNVWRLLGDIKLNRGDVITTRGDLFCGMSNGQSCAWPVPSRAPTAAETAFRVVMTDTRSVLPLAARRETEVQATIYLFRPRDGMGRRGREREVIPWGWMTKHADYLRRQSCPDRPMRGKRMQSLCFHLPYDSLLQPGRRGMLANPWDQRAHGVMSMPSLISRACGGASSQRRRRRRHRSG